MPVGAIKGEPSMNTSQLDYFMRAYECRSFTRAARCFPMSAQGLAKGVHALERELGVTLFQTVTDPGSNASRLVPTPFAEELRLYALEVADSRRRLDEAFARLGARRGERVRLAAAIGSLGLLGMGFIPGFRRDNPDVELVTTDLPDMDVEAALRSGSHEIGLTVAPTDGEAFKTIPLAHCDRYVWVARDDPLAARRRAPRAPRAHDGAVDVRDLEGRDVALVGETFKNYPLLMGALRELDVHPRQIITSAEMVWLHQFAREGGVAFTAETLLPLYADDDAVVALPFVGMPYEVGVSWLATHELTDAERRFVDACERRSRELDDRRRGAARA